MALTLNYYPPDVFAPSEVIELKIRQEAEAQEVDPNLAVLIAYCESRLDPKAKNPNSTASGIFQFIRSTWNDSLIKIGLPLDTDVFDADLNIKTGVWFLKTSGTKPWEASSKCWQNAYKSLQRQSEVRRVGAIT